MIWPDSAAGWLTILMLVLAFFSLMYGLVKAGRIFERAITAMDDVEKGVGSCDAKTDVVLSTLTSHIAEETERFNHIDEKFRDLEIITARHQKLFVTLLRRGSLTKLEAELLIDGIEDEDGSS